MPNSIDRFVIPVPKARVNDYKANEKIMPEPRFADSLIQDDPVFDTKRMFISGFQQLVHAR